jgi:hypothetical protein
LLHAQPTSSCLIRLHSAAFCHPGRPHLVVYLNEHIGLQIFLTLFMCIVMFFRLPSLCKSTPLHYSFSLRIISYCCCILMHTSTNLHSFQPSSDSLLTFTMFLLYMYFRHEE